MKIVEYRHLMCPDQSIFVEALFCFRNGRLEFLNEWLKHARLFWHRWGTKTHEDVSIKYLQEVIILANRFYKNEKLCPNYRMSQEHILKD